MTHIDEHVVRRRSLLRPNEEAEFSRQVALRRLREAVREVLRTDASPDDVREVVDETIVETVMEG